MLSKTNSLFVLTVILLASFCFAQEPKSVPVIEPAAKTQQPKPVAFPYVAQVTADNVYIRAGAGTIWYKCGKLNIKQQVTVVGSEYGWAKIIPPTGSFSWISKDFVTPNPDKPKTGNVTGDSVRVWVGSKDLDPLRSDSYQTKLNTGDKVQLMGEESSGYYKIFPPQGAYLWVSSQYIKYAGPVTKQSPQSAIRENIEDIAAQPKTTADADPVPDAVPDTVTEKQTPVAARPVAEIQRLNECRELGKLIDDQRQRPAEKQDYKKIKTAIETIIKDSEAGKAKLYAEYLSNLIDRFELAIIAQDELQKQDEKLAEATRKIKERLTTELANVPTSAQFTVTGIIKKSQIFTSESGIQRYVVAADTGKIICYAIPAGSIASKDLAKAINKKVTLAGEVIQNPHSAITLIRFSKIYDSILPQKNTKK